MSTASGSEVQGTTSGLDRALAGAANADVKERPQRAVSFRVTAIEDAKQTGGGEGDYMRARITVEPTRGSARFFHAIMFRPEMFSPGFTGAEYVDYKKHPALQQVNPNSAKGGTKGEAYKFVYESNVLPGVKRDRKGQPVIFKKGPRAGQVMTTGETVLQMCCGGTLEGVGNLLSSLDNTFNGTEHTTEDIIGAIRKAIQANQQVEHVAVLRQQRDRASGELSDNWEVNYYLGPLTQEIYDDLVTRAEAKKDEDEIGKRLTISFQV